MVFLGTKFWTETKAVYPLLKSLARGCAYEKLIMISDSEDQVVKFILDNVPTP
jgi:hypothetical protein